MIARRLLEIWLQAAGVKNYKQGKSYMTHDGAGRQVMFASIFLLMFFVGLTLFVSSIARADPRPDSAAGSATFRTKCARCQGQDGEGSEVGKSMHVPDLR